MNNNPNIETTDLQELLGASGFVPEERTAPPAGESETAEYRNLLRQYQLSGRKTSRCPDVAALPVILAPLLRAESTTLSMPLVYDAEQGMAYGLPDVLTLELRKFFDETTALVLADRLSQIAAHRQYESQERDLASTVSLAVDQLLEAPEEGDASEALQSALEQFKSETKRNNALLVKHSPTMAFELLELELVRMRARHEEFMRILKRKAAGLKDLMLLAEREAGPSEADKHYGFASGLLSLDAVEGMSAAQRKKEISGGRSKRLRQCLEILEGAIETYRDPRYIIYTTRDLEEEFSLGGVFGSSTVVTSGEGPAAAARERAEQALGAFVRTMGALRIADLEIAQKYDEGLHDIYFEGFDLAHVGDSELAFMRPIIVVDESERIARDPGSFIGLISGNYPVKILAVNRLPAIAAGGSLPVEQAGHELAALAIFRRSAYVFQGAADTPLMLHQAFRTGLEMSVPALWNLLFAPAGESGGSASPALLRAAVDSRHFPRLEFHLQAGDAFGSHFRIGGNIDPARDFPLCSIDVRTPSGLKSRDLFLTMADHLAALPGAADVLEIVPAGYDLDEFVPVADYLAASPQSQQGRIPFLWVADDQGILHRAVVPVGWIQYCRARLEYWRFIQELGGTRSYHAKQAVEAEKQTWETLREAELEDVRSRLASEFAHTRKEDLGRAITRMLTALLDPGKGLGSTEALLDAMASGKMVTPPAETGQVSNGQPPERRDGAEHGSAEPIPRDAWIESALCTSCSDCIDALPTVFKYNADKQAYVHDPRGGTYAKIVAAAEKCPARCIHPGLPQNPDEPGLDKLVKRAEKFQ